MKKTYCQVRVLSTDSNTIHIDCVRGMDGSNVHEDCWWRFENYIKEHRTDFIGKEFIKIVKYLDFYSTNDCEWIHKCNICDYYSRIILDIVPCKHHIAVVVKSEIETDMQKHQVNTIYGMKLKDHSGRDPWKSNKDPKECYISTSTWHQDVLTEFVAKKSDALDKGRFTGSFETELDSKTWDHITRDEEATKMEKKYTTKELQRKHIDRSRGRLDDLHIKRVIFNDKATILFFTGGSKSVVKCTETDNYSKEAGIALAYLKHVVGADQFHWVMDALMGKKGNTVRSLYDTKIRIIDKTNKEDKNND